MKKMLVCNRTTIFEAVVILGVAIALITPGPILIAEEQRDYWFVNVTDEVQLTGQNAWHLSVADFNGDGYVDIWGHKGVSIPDDILFKQFLYLNVPGDDPGDPYSRKFIDYTEESGIRTNRDGGEGRFVTGGVFADVDNDGDTDMFTQVYVHDSYTLLDWTNDLLINDGSAHFTLAENSPFHTDPVYNTAGSVFCDYNYDGNIDLYIGNWYWNGDLTSDRLYQGHGDGSYTDVTSQAGIDTIPTCVYSLSVFDWENDGLVDLFADSYSRTRPGATPVQWKNNGDGTFTAIHEITGYDDYRGYGSGIASFGSMPWDYDNDGDMDFFEIMVHGSGDGATGTHSTVVTNNESSCSYDFWRVFGRSVEDPDIGHHGDHYASWTDVDNDGLTDFVLTECAYGNNRIYMFMQAPDNTFTPDTLASGLNPINDADLPSHNVIPMDYDLDGDEDLLIGFADSVTPLQLWRNEIGNQNNWISINLEGGGIPGMSNTNAIDARVEVTAGGTTYTREVSAGDGQFGPQMPFRITLGLGSATIIDSIKVYWPNSNHTVTEMNNVPVNQFLIIMESPPVFVDDDFNETTPGWGIDHFDTIQDGIDAADDFGTIHVYSGTYSENILVNKTVTLAGEEVETTIIDGSGSGDVVTMTSDEITIHGFSIQHSGSSGIHVTSNHCIITGNTITNNQNGIYLNQCTDTTIQGNTIDSNTLNGIYFHAADENIIKGNVITNNDRGINIPFDIFSSLNNHIYHNLFLNNTINAFDTGINLWNDTYPSGGNYWDDYTGDDLFSGPGQTIPGWDGIGDTPYQILGNGNHDNYPWMTPDRPLYAYPNGPYEGSTQEPIQFTGSAAGGIPPYTYHWDFGDGGESDEQNPLYQYDQIGTYTATLTVKDSRLIEANSTASVQIIPHIVYVDDDFDETTPGWGVDHFASIQDGIDAVLESGKVYVYSGIYYEHLIIDRQVKLHGEDLETTIIDGYGDDTIINVIADNVAIAHFTIQSGDVGIYMLSDYCSISGNILTNNVDAIRIYNGASNNTVRGNTVTANSLNGIELYRSSENTIKENLISLNGRGINSISGGGYSDNNFIYHNNFIGNAEHASDGCNNIWNDVYPSGGNYWDDHPNPVDVFHGPNQDLPGPDGIIDTPYSIQGGSNQDRYPFLNISGWLAGTWWNYDWGYRKQLTINQSDIPETQVDFPVLLYQSADDDIAAQAQSDGDDIVFADASGMVQLDHEIEHYNSSTGELVAWVRIPELSSENNTIFYVYYGNPECENQQNVTSVWDSNYIMVQHLDETEGIHEDSTSNDNDGIAHGDVTQDAPGQIDGADHFDGSGDYINCGTNESHNIRDAVTIEVWVNTEHWGSHEALVFKGDHENAIYYIWYPTSGGIEWATQGTSDAYLRYSPSVIEGEWYYLVCTYDKDAGSNNKKIFFDGHEQAAETVTGSILSSAGQPLNIAKFSTYYFNGLIDEVRISNIARNPAWVNISFNNQHSPSSFITIGEEEQLSQNSPPEPPAKPTGRIWGVEDTLYTYTTSTTDPEGDQVYYQWDWDAGPLSDWLGPFDSGAPATAQHAWSNPGRYYIKVRAKDIHGAVSDWSEAQLVAMRRWGLLPIQCEPWGPD